MRSHFECGLTLNAVSLWTLPSGAASPLFNHMLISEFWHTLVPGWSATSHFAHEKSTFHFVFDFFGTFLAFFEFVFSVWVRKLSKQMSREFFPTLSSSADSQLFKNMLISQFWETRVSARARKWKLVKFWEFPAQCVKIQPRFYHPQNFVGWKIGKL